MIKTNRLIIREMTLEDYNELKRILSDSETMKFWPKPFTDEQVESWIKRNIDSYKENGYGRWIVQLKENNEVIGDVGFLKTEIDGSKVNDLGYIIYSKHWGKGYGTEAAKACMGFGFKELGMKKIIANMPYNHYTSQRVAEKIDMIKEKEFINRRNRDILTYIYSQEG